MIELKRKIISLYHAGSYISLSLESFEPFRDHVYLSIKEYQALGRPTVGDMLKMILQGEERRG